MAALAIQDLSCSHMSHSEEKTKTDVRLVKTQNSLCIRVRFRVLVVCLKNFCTLDYAKASSEDSGQTAQADLNHRRGGEHVSQGTFSDVVAHMTEELLITLDNIS